MLTSPRNSSLRGAGRGVSRPPPTPCLDDNSCEEGPLPQGQGLVGHSMEIEGDHQATMVDYEPSTIHTGTHPEEYVTRSEMNARMEALEKRYQHITDGLLSRIQHLEQRLSSGAGTIFPSLTTASKRARSPPLPNKYVPKSFQLPRARDVATGLNTSRISVGSSTPAKKLIATPNLPTTKKTPTTANLGEKASSPLVSGGPSHHDATPGKNTTNVCAKMSTSTTSKISSAAPVSKSSKTRTAATATGGSVRGEHPAAHREQHQVPTSSRTRTGSCRTITSPTASTRGTGGFHNVRPEPLESNDIESTSAHAVVATCVVSPTMGTAVTPVSSEQKIMNLNPLVQRTTGDMFLKCTAGGTTPATEVLVHSIQQSSSGGARRAITTRKPAVPRAPRRSPDRSAKNIGLGPVDVATPRIVATSASTKNSNKNMAIANNLMQQVHQNNSLSSILVNAHLSERAAARSTMSQLNINYHCPDQQHQPISTKVRGVVKTGGAPKRAPRPPAVPKMRAPLVVKAEVGGKAQSTSASIMLPLVGLEADQEESIHHDLDHVHAADHQAGEDEMDMDIIHDQHHEADHEVDLESTSAIMPLVGLEADQEVVGDDLLQHKPDHAHGHHDVEQQGLNQELADVDFKEVLKKVDLFSSSSTCTTTTTKSTLQKTNWTIAHQGLPDSDAECHRRLRAASFARFDVNRNGFLRLVEVEKAVETFLDDLQGTTSSLGEHQVQQGVVPKMNMITLSLDALRPMIARLYESCLGANPVSGHKNAGLFPKQFQRFLQQVKLGMELHDLFGVPNCDEGRRVLVKEALEKLAEWGVPDYRLKAQFGKLVSASSSVLLEDLCSWAISEKRASETFSVSTAMPEDNYNVPPVAENRYVEEEEQMITSSPEVEERQEGAASGVPSACAVEANASERKMNYEEDPKVHQLQQEVVEERDQQDDEKLQAQTVSGVQYFSMDMDPPSPISANDEGHLEDDMFPLAVEGVEGDETVGVEGDETSKLKNLLQPLEGGRKNLLPLGRDEEETQETEKDEGKEKEPEHDVAVAQTETAATAASSGSGKNRKKKKKKFQPTDRAIM
ncbi:unnamed protein product [Amoebophrya sp. A25]|nr:unnamed protein product [Amoebophrya sp. A25]|eukprot:GSA25T00026231001.1